MKVDLLRLLSRHEKPETNVFQCSLFDNITKVPQPWNVYVKYYNWIENCCDVKQGKGSIEKTLWIVQKTKIRLNLNTKGVENMVSSPTLCASE